MKIGKRKIIKGTRDPFIVAEIGVNYYDIAKKLDLELIEGAELMIKEAAKAGADAVKFQMYKAETLTSKNSPAYWDTTKEKTQSQFELFKKYDKLEYYDYSKLVKICKENDIEFMATPFDLEAVDVLGKWVSVYKVASADITNKPLIEEITKTNKPMLLSTGGTELSEIQTALKWIQLQNNENEVAFLHCVLSYPTKQSDANLGMIRNLIHKFPNQMIGYSDHVPPDNTMETLIYAHLLGASILEKHFTLDKTLPGNDHYHAMDPDDLVIFKKRMSKLNELYGREERVVLDCELESRKQARRSIVTAKFINKGEIITQEMLIMKRPGTGISPIKIEQVINNKAKKNIEKDKLIEWSDIELSQ